MTSVSTFMTSLRVKNQFLKRTPSDSDPLEDYFIRSSRFSQVSTVNSPSRLLQLPRKLRLEIWKRVHYKHFDNLRLTCHAIADDIDHHLGISALVDDRENEFYDYFENIGIRKATVNNLSSPKVIAKLKHPELLAQLIIKGPISAAFFSYFMKNCRNISSLSLNFTKVILAQKPLFFPQPFRCLPSVRALKCMSHTKTSKDLVYVCDNLTALFKDTLDYHKSLVDLNFTLSHKSPSPYLDQIALEIFMLAYRNHATLQGLVTIVREYSTTGEGEDSGQSFGAPRRGTELPGTKKLSVVVPPTPPPPVSPSSRSYIAFKADKRNSQVLESAEKYLVGRKWPSFPYLKLALIIVNSNIFQHAQQLLPKANSLRHLSLEICGGIYTNSWLCFESVIKDTSWTLTSIKLSNISYEDYLQTPLDLDLSIFKYCESLKQLHLSCPKRETSKVPKARNVSTLPRSLVDIEIYCMTLTWWQWFKLLHSFKRLDSLTVGYIRNDSCFGCFLTTLRRLIACNMTKVQQLVMIDFKIRFRNRRAWIKNLMKAVPIQIEYRDREETLLIMDRGPNQGSEHSIPSISSG